MKFLFVLCVVLAVSCSAFGESEQSQLAVVRSRRDLMEHSMKLVQDLVANLEKAAQEALAAVGQFSSGLLTEATHIRDKILEDIQLFRKKISEAIENVYEKFSDATSSVKECVDAQRDHAGLILDETTTNTLACVDEKIGEISTMIQELKTLANEAISFASGAMSNMKNCTQGSSGLVSTGTCLGGIMVQTEAKTASFLAHSAVTVARINIGIAGLPATMQVCAGKNLIGAGVETGKIVVEIGSCSVTTIFNNFTAKP